MSAFRRCFWGLVILLLSFDLSHATHIRGGEITVEQVSCHELTFRIILTAYVNLASSAQFGVGSLNFGDGSDSIIPREDMVLIEERNLGNGFGRIRFEIMHAYPSNDPYTLSYTENNRNAGILNMDNSAETPFYIETRVLIEDFECCNSYPVLLIPPNDNACSGIGFFHNPGAWDADGDSLSYELISPRQSENDEVDNYRFPNEIGGNTESGNAPASFKIDPVTGEIAWDSPGPAGQYNIAFIIKEWRKIDSQDILISSITKDMQINVLACDNRRPEVIIPEEICVEAGTLLTEMITGSDPDGDSILVEMFGGPVSPPDTSAEFNYNLMSSEGLFKWQTSCDHIRGQPYQINFKISEVGDNESPLASIRSWNVTVLPPPPKGVDLTILPGRKIRLDWEPYSCSNAEAIRIWRRVDSYDFSRDCRAGMPHFAGYEMIAELDPGITSFTDDNNGNFLAFGALNCYRLVAVFPACGIEESIASVEVCGLIEAEAPVITNVSIAETNRESGEVFVRWTRPFEINEGSFPPPYFYDLYRADSITGGNFTLIKNNLAETDTLFTDIPINTQDLGYTYYVVLKDANKIPLISSSTASSVKLYTTPHPGEIEITWEAYVPWSNNTQSYPMHYIYRNHFTEDPKEIVLIDSVNVNLEGFRYLDRGQSRGEGLNENEVYCYYIRTLGSYGNPRIRAPLINDSQVFCGQIEDHSAPCMPDLNLSMTNCDAFLSNLTNCGNTTTSYENRLSWSFPAGNECIIEDLDSYKIYYSHDGSEPFTLIGSVNDSEFTHENLESFAGCYYVTAVDLNGNESAPGPVFCNDNCPGYVLPNIFTPNGDSHNDVFKALNSQDNPDLDPKDCPLFVKHVLFKVFNRNGKVLFIYDSGGENNILIGWNGSTEAGKELPSGIYYYSAEVFFDMVDPDKQMKNLKGWVQILR